MAKESNGGSRCFDPAAAATVPGSLLLSQVPQQRPHPAASRPAPNLGCPPLWLQLKPGYDGVPKLVAAFQQGIPHKVAADKQGSLVFFGHTEVGELHSGLLGPPACSCAGKRGVGATAGLLAMPHVTVASHMDTNRAIWFGGLGCRHAEQRD